jgi:mycofactocin precursor
MANAAGGLVEVGLADAGLADTALADTGLADTGLADTGLADTSQAHDDKAGQPTWSAGSAQDEVPLIDDLLVEEISIDGMCGVY